MLDFESAFSNFIDRREYDQAEAALFSMIRLSFKAGWMAAGGKAPKAQNVVELIKPQQANKREADLVMTNTYLDGE